MLEIIKRIQNGENNLIGSLINSNEEFIYSYAEKYKDIFDDYEELKQEAICIFIYLIKCYKFNCYFSTFISTKMNMYMNRFILSNMERIPKIEDRITLSKYFYNKCTKYLNYKPTLSELRRYLGIKKIYVEQLFNYACEKASYIDYKDGICGFVDENYELVERNLDSELFKEKVLKSSLTKKQAESLILNYGFNSKPKSFVEIGKIENTSRQTIFDRVENGKTKLKKVLMNGVKGEF